MRVHSDLGHTTRQLIVHVLQTLLLLFQGTAGNQNMKKNEYGKLPLFQYGCNVSVTPLLTLSNLVAFNHTIVLLGRYHCNSRMSGRNVLIQNRHENAVVAVQTHHLLHLPTVSNFSASLRILLLYDITDRDDIYNKLVKRSSLVPYRYVLVRC